MSDEQVRVSEDAVAETEVVAVPEAEVVRKPLPYPVIILGVAVVVLLVLLLALNLRGGADAGGESSESLSELRAELDARRAELNRERMAMGLSPISGGSEPLDDIAARLRKDSETLVSLAGRFQQMLAEKDAEISAKSSELIQSEKVRHNLALETARLQTELQRAIAGGADGELLRQELQTRREQQERLEAMLLEARQELAKLASSASGGAPEDVEVLRRQLEEAQRARDFFERRVSELEGQPSLEDVPELPAESEE
jgi:chromosome segregation ATPase